jgi:hypothetical protein
MGLSLVLGSTGWAGLVLSNTVLDPFGSQQLARQALSNPSVRAVLVDRMGDGMARILPDDVPMSRQELAVAAGNAVDDPSARDVLRDAVADAHRRGLANQEADDPFAHFNSNEAARLALIDEQPRLTGRILVNPLVRIVLPTAGLTWLSGVRLLVDRFAIAAIALGVVGFAAAFVVAESATATMRRAAWWILGAAAFWTLAAVAFDTVAQALTPSSYVLLASAVESFFTALRVPTILMTTFGLGMLAASMVIPALEVRRGGFLLAAAERRHRGSPDPTIFRPSTDAVRPAPGSRFSAAWREGHGYLDDSRVAPFLAEPDADLIGVGFDRIGPDTRLD